MSINRNDSIDYSLIYMKQMYHQAREAGKDKKVIISETGWPSQGGSLKSAHANTENFIRYFVNAQQWSPSDQIEMFYFSSFDESWKNRSRRRCRCLLGTVGQK